MTPDRNTFSDVWDQLDAKYAERVRVTDAATVGDEEIVRRWKDIGEGYLSRCITALSLFTDAKNTKPQLWVKDPVCGREVFPGIYRIVTVDVDIQKAGLKGIIQTLRKGWAQDADWLEARLVESERGPANDVSQSGVVDASDNPTKLLKIKFPNCDPGKAESIASSLGSVSTYSNVVVRGETYSGTWNTVWAASRLEEDGSGTVTLFLALAQYNLKSYDNWGTEREQDIFYVYDCPKAEAQGIIESWKSAYPVGSSATTNYSRSNGLVDLVLRRRTETTLEADFGTTGLDCRYTETQTAIFGTDDDEAYPIPAVSNDAGVSYNRSVRSNGDGTFDVILTKREVRYRDITGLVVERSGDSVTTQEQQLGLTDETPASMDEEAGKIKTQRVEIRDDCSRDVTTTAQTGKAQETSEITVTKAYTETRVEKTVQSAEIAEPSQETGKIKRVRNGDSKYPQRYDTMESERTIHPIPEVVEYDTADDAGSHSTATEDIGIANNGGLVVELEAGAGESVQAAVRYDKESDTLDVTKVVTAANEQEARRTEQRGDASIEVVDKTATAVPADDATEVSGSIVRVENKESRFKGRYDTSVLTETGKEQESKEITVAKSYTQTKTEKTYQDSPVSDPAQEAGYVRTVRNSDSKYPGKVDTIEVEREIIEEEGAAEYDIADDADAHAVAEESIGIKNAGGTIIELAASENEAISASVQYDKESDTLDVRKITETSKPAAGAASEVTNIESSVVEIKKNAATENAPTAGDGETIEFERVPTKFKDRFNVRIRTTTGITKTTTSTVANETETVSIVEKLAVSDESAPTVGNGERVDFEKSPSKFKNKVNVRIVTRSGTSKTIGGSTGYLAHHDGSNRLHYRKLLLNIPEDSIPVPTDKAEKVTVSPSGYKGLVNAEFSRVDVTEWFIDFDEPSTSGKSPAMNRRWFWIKDASTIQEKIDDFLEKVAEETDEQYSIGADIGRDENGYYNLVLSANPKSAGGSVTDWETGLDVDIPPCKKYSQVNQTEAKVLFTTSRVAAQSFLDGFGSTLVDFGAGGSTGIRHLGRGRYKVTAVIEVS